MYLRSVLMCIVFMCALSHGAAVENRISILASGDAHGMVQACDCPHDPGGGLPKRAFYLKTQGQKESYLLLDAGGFAAGGLYDSYTEGRIADSIKTIQMVKGMGEIGYDAVAVGDDDLQYGAEWLLKRAGENKVPLISANVFKNNEELLFSPFVLVKKRGKVFGITALTSDEKIVLYDTDITTSDPVKSLKKIWKQLVEKSDYQIILSHLGQEKSFALRDSFPDADLIVNGHRKNDQAPVAMGRIPVLHFGFQGKSVSSAVVTFSPNKLQVVKSNWITIGPGIPDDSSMVKVISAVASQKNRSVYDLYIMSQCPYGLEALRGFLPFIKQFQNVDWNIWFIGQVEKDSVLNSLHGPEEVKDEMLWLAVKERYPSKWYDFLVQRAGQEMPTETILKNMGIPKSELDKWIAVHGISMLSGHYLRSIRLNIKASPTLLINNVPYEKEITSERLSKFQCLADRDSTGLCDSLPECFEASDCKEKGKIGRCVEKKCVFSDAVPFTFTVLVADSTRQNPENTVIATTEDLFPGAIIEKVTMNSKRGASLIKMYTPEALPFYVFGKDVKQAYNFTEIEGGLIERESGLVFRKGIVRSNYYFNRSLEKGKVILFIDPFFKGVKNVLNSILSDSSLHNITIAPVFFSDPQDDLWGTEEGFRQEEALRWLVLDAYYKDKLKDYLKRYAGSTSNTYWFKNLDSIGISSDAFISKLHSNSDIINNHWKTLVSLLIREPVVLLVNNRELAVAGNEKELQSLLRLEKQ